MWLIERITRVLAAWRSRRWDAIRRRRAAKRAVEARRLAEMQAYERAHVSERLLLARSLMDRAAVFAGTPQGQWAFSTFGRWRLCGALEIDAAGRLWRRGERHWFGSVADKAMDSPETLAASFSTLSLRQALRLAEPNRFWVHALEEELLHHFGFRGRPI